MDPSRRPGAGNSGYATLKNHPFFKGTDWTKLREGTTPPTLASEPGVRLFSFSHSLFWPSIQWKYQKLTQHINEWWKIKSLAHFECFFYLIFWRNWKRQTGMSTFRWCKFISKLVFHLCSVMVSRQVKTKIPHWTQRVLGMVQWDLLTEMVVVCQLPNLLT